MADARNDLDSLAHTSRDLHAALHRDAPLVQCLTNFVSMNYAANVLLAAGASPAMVHAAEEAPSSRASAARWSSTSARCRSPGSTACC